MHEFEKDCRMFFEVNTTNQYKSNKQPFYGFSAVIE